MIFFYIYCLFFSLDGSKFPHPNHGLKFSTLDAKIVATEATFMMCDRMLPKFLLSHRTKIIPT